MVSKIDSRLIAAAIEGDIALVKSLIIDGIDPNLQDKKGYSALHYAAQRYDAELAKLLIDAGAKVDLKDSWGNTALFKAVFNSMGRSDVIDLLLRAGADRNSKNNSGVSPYELAKTIDNYAIAQFLE